MDTHDIDNLAFNDDMVKSKFITNPKADLPQLCEQYQTTHKTLLYKHPPVRSKAIQIKASAQCIAPEIINANVNCRYLKRIWKKYHAHTFINRSTKHCHE